MSGLSLDRLSCYLNGLRMKFAEEVFYYGRVDVGRERRKRRRGEE